MNCKEVMDAINNTMPDEVTSAMFAAVMKHVFSCEKCAEELKNREKEPSSPEKDKAIIESVERATNRFVNDPEAVETVYGFSPLQNIANFMDIDELIDKLRHHG